MLYKKTEQIITKWPFGVYSNDSITKTDSSGKRKKYDRIFLENSEGLARTCGLGDILYRHVIEVAEDGGTVIKTPFTTQDVYKISKADDPFLQSAFQVFDELKRGEHLEEQWAPEALEDNEFNRMFPAKMMSIEKFKDLYLEVMDGLIFICSKVEIGENELTKSNGWMVDAVTPIVKKVEGGAFAMREVMCVHKKYW